MRNWGKSANKMKRKGKRRMENGEEGERKRGRAGNEDESCCANEIKLKCLPNEIIMQLVCA